MSGKNGLIGASPVFYDGERPIWASADSPEFTGVATFVPQITVQDSLTAPASATEINPAQIVLQTELNTTSPNDVFLTADSAGDLIITAQDKVRFFPGGATLPGVVFNCEAESVEIVPFDGTQAQVIVASSGAPVQNLVVNPGTREVGYDFGGRNNWITLGGVQGTYILQLQSSATTWVPGTTLDFYINTAGTAGSIISWEYNATTITSLVISTAIADQGCWWVRLFTPNGTTWYRAKMNFDAP